MNFQQIRRDKLRALAFSDSAADALLVTNLVNIRYLTGFTGSNATLCISRQGAHDDRIVTDGRYADQVVAQCAGLPVIINRNLFDGADLSGYQSISVEPENLTLAQATQLRTTYAKLELVDGKNWVEELRKSKEPQEITYISQACAIADAALNRLVESGKIAVGRTERAIARDLEWEMYQLGAEAISFETIVATGKNSAIPHHRPTDASVEFGDFVKIDFGSVVAGYHSDTTRTFVMGTPAQWQREIYDVVARAQLAGCAAATAEALAKEVDSAAREIIAAAGYADNYIHGLGHGVGLEIHEAPGIGETAEGRLPVGTVVTVEPGIYLPGRGGVRIEDTVVVGTDEPTLLTRYPKDLIII